MPSPVFRRRRAVAFAPSLLAVTRAPLLDLAFPKVNDFGMRIPSNPIANVVARVAACSAFILAAAVGSVRSASAQSAPVDLSGEWRLEFRSVPSTTDSSVKSAPWLNFTVTMVQVDSAIGGAMRSDGPSGQFGCKRRGNDVCEAGRMRLSWDEQDWQLFEFRLTPGDSNKGEGKAEIRFPTGATDRYAFTMVRP